MRILNYIVIVVIGIVAIIVGALVAPSKWFIAFGIATALAGIWAWIRGLPLLAREDRPGVRAGALDWAVIVGLYVVSFVVAAFL
ncbi:MAG: hypothetical protein GTO18_11105 [Anaerolineales bacterium]|nr:hypothetical protein [Anaerolineales bacterium]